MLSEDFFGIGGDVIPKFCTSYIVLETLRDMPLSQDVHEDSGLLGCYFVPTGKQPERSSPRGPKSCSPELPLVNLILFYLCFGIVLHYCMMKPNTEAFIVDE